MRVRPRPCGVTTSLHFSAAALAFMCMARGLGPARRPLPTRVPPPAAWRPLPGLRRPPTPPGAGCRPLAASRGPYDHRRCHDLRPYSLTSPGPLTSGTRFITSGLSCPGFSRRPPPPVFLRVPGAASRGGSRGGTSADGRLVRLRLSFPIYKWVVVPGHTKSPVAVSMLVANSRPSRRPRGWAGAAPSLRGLRSFSTGMSSFPHASGTLSNPDPQSPSPHNFYR